MRHTAQRIIVPPVFRGSYVVSSSRLCFPVPSSFPFHLLWSGFVRSSPHYSLPSGGDGVNEEREAETSERHPTKGRGVKAKMTRPNGRRHNRLEWLTVLCTGVWGRVIQSQPFTALSSRPSPFIHSGRRPGRGE